MFSTIYSRVLSLLVTNHIYFCEHNALITEFPKSVENCRKEFVQDASVKSSAGRMVVYSKTIFFNLNSPEPFPVVPVAVASTLSLAFLGVGLLFFRRHRKIANLKQ